MKKIRKVVDVVYYLLIALLFIYCIGLVGQSDYETEVGIYTPHSYYTVRMVVCLVIGVVAYFVRCFAWYLTSPTWYKLRMYLYEKVMLSILMEMEHISHTRSRRRIMTEVYQRWISQLIYLEELSERRCQYGREEGTQGFHG